MLALKICHISTTLHSVVKFKGFHVSAPLVLYHHLYILSIEKLSHCKTTYFCLIQYKLHWEYEGGQYPML